MRKALHLLLALAAGAFVSPALAAVVVIETELVASQRVGRTTYEYTYRVTAQSDAAVTLTNVTATVSSSTTATTIVDGNLDFGDLDPALPAVSSDTFSFRQNRRSAFDPTALTYQFSFDTPPAPATGGALNDTGVTTCSDFTSDGLDCSSTADFPGQDGQIGRGGFTFTKLDGTGSPLGDQTADFATTPWSCVRDEVTGLTWEVKTSAGLRAGDGAYRFEVVGGFSLSRPCNGLAVCSTQAYIDEINANSLCGFSDWRLPTRNELFGLVDFGAEGAAIDTNYFPNAKLIQAYWSDTGDGLTPSRVRTVTFNDGASYDALTTDFLPIRLVQGRKQQ